MCCHLPLRPSLGGAKVYIEAAEVYRGLGHEVSLVGIDEVVQSSSPFMDESWRVEYYPKILKEYILNNNSKFDVIEFESIYLPFDLKGRVKSLLVARSVLLDLHQRNIIIPRFRGFRSLLGVLLKSGDRRKKLNKKIQQSMQTIKYADYVNVPNPSDQLILETYGVPKNKIIVQPYGIFEERYNFFKSSQVLKKENIGLKKIAFVGTFDNRKGAVEFPLIIRELIKTNPNVEFKLLGILGMFPTADSVYNYIGTDLKNNIIIIPKFNPNDLPELLKDCIAGVFPSYLESFGFGVLEMMAMGLPVVGYDSPGVNMLLPKELMVKAGDYKSIVHLLSRLINENEFYNQATSSCENKSREFIYERQRNKSIEVYSSSKEF